MKIEKDLIWQANKVVAEHLLKIYKDKEECGCGNCRRESDDLRENWMYGIDRESLNKILKK